MNIQIISTTDYKLFKVIKVNREVKRKHVDKLIAAIKKRNMLHLNPIIVDSSHNVIDGQHRLQAAKELKYPIYYVVDSNVSEGDIAGLNSNKSNWSAKEYIEYYAKKGIEAYMLIKKLVTEFPKISYPIAMELLNDRRSSSDFRDGNFIANNYDSAIDLLNKANDFDFFEWRFEQRFLRALKQCIETGEYKHDKMLEQANRESGRMRLKKCYFHDDYIMMLEDIYNFKQQTEIANFRLTKAKREKIAAKNERLQKTPVKKEYGYKTKEKEIKFADEFLGKNKKQKKNIVNESEKTLRVKINEKTTIMVKPGTDIAALRRKYDT